jgi:solute carrier family 32 (vesicular inhibitory amino acid transporter)
MLIRLVPTIFLPLRLLSFTSFIGILSTVFIVIVLFIDGLSKKSSPGSLWKPAETSVGPGTFRELGISFGVC